MMNRCEDRHEKKFLITYKPAPGGLYVPKWLVCENCVDNKRCFGDEDLIQSIEKVA
jgi:hypothetical protein